MHSFDLVKETLLDATPEQRADTVVFYLDCRERYARSIYNELKGCPMKPIKFSGNWAGAVEITSHSEAMHLLEGYAGKAGVLLARTLKEQVPTTFSDVMIWPSFSAVSVKTETRDISFSVMDYDQPMMRLHQSSPRTSRNKSTIWRLELSDGRSVPLCCPWGSATETALLIERVVATLTKRDTNADLDIVAALRICNPMEIAEAVRALRKLENGRAPRIFDVLRRYDGVLKGISRKVKRELTGRLPNTTQRQK
jgi:hypothetical protein